MKVSNMTSTNGNAVPNQFIIENNGCSYFHSYDSTIAKIGKNGQITLDKTYWDYSRTTAKYRNQFTGFDTQETKLRIKSGEIKLVNLNK